MYLEEQRRVRISTRSTACPETPFIPLYITLGIWRRATPYPRITPDSRPAPGVSVQQDGASGKGYLD